MPFTQVNGDCPRCFAADLRRAAVRRATVVGTEVLVGHVQDALVVQRTRQSRGEAFGIRSIADFEVQFVVIVGVVWASICCAELDVSTFGPIVGAVFAVIWAIYAGDSVRMRSTFLPVTSPPAGGQRGRYPSHQPHSGTLASDTIVP